MGAPQRLAVLVLALLGPLPFGGAGAQPQFDPAQRQAEALDALDAAARAFAARAGVLRSDTGSANGASRLPGQAGAEGPAAVSSNAQAGAAPADAALARRVYDQSAQLRAALEGLPADGLYIAAIATDAALIRAGDEERVGAASDDLALKLDHLRQGAGLRKTWDGNLRVVVTTVRGGRQVDGFLVRLNMAGVPDAPTPFVVFNNPSSPTEAGVPPGNYVLRLERAGEQPVVRLPVAVTGRGESVEIKVEVP